jgi:transposase-like protein
LHYPIEVILTCALVRGIWAESAQCRGNMAERRRSIDHSTVLRWVINLLPVQEKGFRRRKSPIGKSVSGVRMRCPKASAFLLPQ